MLIRIHTDVFLIKFLCNRFESGLEEKSVVKEKLQVRSQLGAVLSLLFQ